MSGYVPTYGGVRQPSSSQSSGTVMSGYVPTYGGVRQPTSGQGSGTNVSGYVPAYGSVKRPSSSQNNVQRLTADMANVSMGPPRPKSAPPAINSWNDMDKYYPQLYSNIIYASRILKKTRFRPFQPAFPRWNLNASVPRPSAYSAPRPSASGAPRPSASGAAPSSGSRSKSYKCGFCEKSYPSRDDMEIHEEDKHFVCRYCGKRRRDRADQKSHQARCKDR